MIILTLRQKLQAIQTILTFFRSWIIHYFHSSVRNASSTANYFHLKSKIERQQQSANIRQRIKRQDRECRVMIGDIQAGQVAYERFAAIIDIGIKQANDLRLPANITLRKHHVPERPRSSGPCISGCTAVRALDMLQSGTRCHVFLGPDTPNGVNNIQGVAYAYNIPILTPAEYGIIHREEANLILLPFFHVTDLTNVLMKFLRWRGYTYVALIQDQSDALFDAFGEEFLNLYSRYFSNTSDYTRITPIQFRRYVTTDDELRASLSYARTRARVFVVFAFFEQFKHILLLAEQLDMTSNEFQYVTIHPYDDLFYGSTDLGLVRQQADQQLRLLRILQGSVGMFSIKLSRSALSSDFQDLVRLRARQDYNYSFPATERIDPLVTTHYDFVMVLASAIESLYNKGLDYRDGTLLAKYIRNMTYHGVQTGAVHIDANGNSHLSYEILGVASGATDFSPTWEYDVQTDGFVQVRELTGPPARDVPLCGFTGNELVCQQDHRVPVSVIVIAVVLPLLLVAGVIGWIFYSTVRKLRIQLKPDWWKITLTEIHFTHQRTRTFNGVYNRSLASFTSSASSELPPPHYHGRAFSTARYMECDVLVQHVPEAATIKATSSATLKEINLLRNVDHENLLKVLGLLVDKQESMVMAVVTEECSKGDLTTLLSNHTFTLDWVVKASFIKDLVHGLAYLHSTSLRSHGNLTSHNCLVNGKFTLKVSGYGLSFLRLEEEQQPLIDTQQARNYHDLLWRAPELLSAVMPLYGTQKGDVYSFAIILSQIILESQPYESPKGSANQHTAAEIALEVKDGNTPPTRPHVPRSACSAALYEMMELCWNQIPLERPSFVKNRDHYLKKILGSTKENIVDQLLKRMDQYANTLEKKVAEKAQQLLEEKKRTDELLHAFLPGGVTEALTRGDSVEPEFIPSVTIYFGNIMELIEVCSGLTPVSMTSLMNALDNLVEGTVERHDLFRVKGYVGDGYMMVSGIVNRLPTAEQTASAIATAALHLQKEVQSFYHPDTENQTLQLRAGMASGAVVAGLVGSRIPQYYLFGQAVITARLMEATGQATKIQVADSTQHLLPKHYDLQERTDKTEAAGKGSKSYWLTSYRQHRTSNY